MRTHFHPSLIFQFAMRIPFLLKTLKARAFQLRQKKGNTLSLLEGNLLQSKYENINLLYFQQ